MTGGDVENGIPLVVGPMKSKANGVGHMSGATRCHRNTDDWPSRSTQHRDLEYNLWPIQSNRGSGTLNRSASISNPSRGMTI
jgi:hypothetical protein